jgi:hypothetical protein
VEKTKKKIISGKREGVRIPKGLTSGEINFILKIETYVPNS